MLRTVILAICIIIFAISMNLIIQNYIQDNNNRKTNVDLVKKVFTTQVNNTGLEKSGTKIDWDELKKINKDIIGWIEIPNTNINYPILKDENLYYLNHNFERKNNKNGSIFIRNQDLLKNQEIIIYGHNMKNGTMFSELGEYLNQDFFEKNSKIYIYTKENTYEGNIFAAYSKGVNEEKEAIKELNLYEKIEYYKNQSVYSSKVENNINKIVKLTTCSYINMRATPTDQRYYIIAEIR